MRRLRITKRASYREGVAWIALNDNPGGDPADGSRPYDEVRATIAGYISTLLLADLFGADPDLVAADIFRYRAFEIVRASAAPGPARRIRRNAFDNWYGYLGSRRVRAFGNGPEETAEAAAERWRGGDDTAGTDATLSETTEVEL